MKPMPANRNPIPTNRTAEPYESPEWHPAFEEYCETIFELDEDNLQVIQARIAERLQISRPAVSETIKRMKSEGLVEEGRGTIKLTETGRALAETIVRRHRIAERFLTDILKLPWADAHTEAGKWEHVISPVVEQAMIQLLDDPTTCPHGNPIPGSGYKGPNLVTLDTLTVGSEFTVHRIPEELEFKPGMLEFLEEAHIMPGSDGKITALSPTGACTLDIDGHPVGLGSYTTSRILVTPIPAQT